MNFDWTEKNKDFKSRVAGLFDQAGRTMAESLGTRSCPNWNA